MSAWTVIKPWAAVYADPIRVEAWEPVEVGRADDDAPGWRWCTDPRGKEGWMPHAWVDESGCARRGYDARELTVAVDDLLTALEEHEGWRWCQARDGQTGWVPAAHLATTAMVELCDRWLESWTGGESERLLSFFAEDATYRDPAHPGGLQGHAELGPYFSALLQHNPDWTWRRVEFIPTGTGFTLKWRATIPVGESVLHEEGLDIVEVRDGKITRNEVYFDRAALLRLMRGAG